MRLLLPDMHAHVWDRSEMAPQFAHGITPILVAHANQVEVARSGGAFPVRPGTDPMSPRVLFAAIAGE